MLDIYSQELICCLCWEDIYTTPVNSFQAAALGSDSEDDRKKKKKKKERKEKKPNFNPDKNVWNQTSSGSRYLSQLPLCIQFSCHLTSQYNSCPEIIFAARAQSLWKKKFQNLLMMMHPLL